MHKVVSSSRVTLLVSTLSRDWPAPDVTILIYLVCFSCSRKRILVGHHNIGVILQYSHILQTQTRFIIQLSTPYRVTLCHTMSHCHCTGWKQPQLTAFWTVWHHFYSLRAETVVRGREGGRDTMRERDTEKNRVRERMRKREGRDGMR